MWMSETRRSVSRWEENAPCRWRPGTAAGRSETESWRTWPRWWTWSAETSAPQSTRCRRSGTTCLRCANWWTRNKKPAHQIHIWRLAGNNAGVARLNGTLLACVSPHEAAAALSLSLGVVPQADVVLVERRFAHAASEAGRSHRRGYLGQTQAL